MAPCWRILPALRRLIWMSSRSITRYGKMKKEKYKFPAGIELEYRIPEGSSTMAEISKCLQFCKDALA